jgi:hypothetical protein
VIGRCCADDDVNLAQLHMLSQILTLCPAEDVVLSPSAIPPLMIDLMRLLAGSNQDMAQRAIHNLVRLPALIVELVRICVSPNLLWTDSRVRCAVPAGERVPCVAPPGGDVHGARGLLHAVRELCVGLVRLARAPARRRRALAAQAGGCALCA